MPAPAIPVSVKMIDGGKGVGLTDATNNNVELVGEALNVIVLGPLAAGEPVTTCGALWLTVTVP